MNNPNIPNPSAREVYLKVASFADAQARAAYLDHACNGDRKLREDIEKLLSVPDENTPDLLSQALDLLNPRAANAVSGTATACLPISSANEKTKHPEIDRYKLLEEIGRGGMGTVYMAQQTEPVRRRVAVKVINPGMDSREVVARFEAERQALAMMDHPNIARIFDGGATDHGTPYFVMELVPGITITDYCNKRDLSLDDRLRLFIKVCHAVQHAHQKGIIHRDLKPSNIQVTHDDGKPVVKVIDFGVAKALNQDLTNKTLYTQFSQLVGTPLYMSPEQADPHGTDIDTRSDVYSLGVLLYELLTGTTPFSREQLSEAGVDSARKLICTADPPRPSIRVSTLLAGRDSTFCATNIEGLRANRLPSRLRGDLDWIAMKCLEKERDRRYETANAIGDDLERFLEHQPIVACPPSTIYAAKKFIRRHRLPVSLLVAVLSGMILCMAVLSWGLNRVQTERDRAQLAATQAAEAKKAEETHRLAAESQKLSAERSAADSDAVVDYLVRDVIAQASPRTQADMGLEVIPDISVREALDRSVKRLDRFQDNPRVEAKLRRTAGFAYLRLNLTEKAIEQCAKAAKLYQNLDGANSDQAMAAKSDLADALLREQRFEECLPILRELVTAYEQTKERIAPSLLHAKQSLANCYIHIGEADSALGLAQAAYRACLEGRGSEDKWTQIFHNIMGMAYEEMGDFEHAAGIYSTLYEADVEQYGEAHQNTLTSMNNLANVYLRMGHNQKAVVLLQQAVTGFEQRLGPQHYETRKSKTNYAKALYRTNHVDEALPILQDILASMDVPSTSTVAFNVKTVGAQIYMKLGHYQRAKALLASLCEARSQLRLAPQYSNDDPQFLYAVVLARVGEPAESITILTSLLDHLKGDSNADEPFYAANLSAALAEAHWRKGGTLQAIDIMRQNIEHLGRERGEEHTFYMQAILGILMCEDSGVEEGMKQLETAYAHTSNRQHGITLASRAAQYGRKEQALAQVDLNIKAARNELPPGGSELANELRYAVKVLIDVGENARAELVAEEVLEVFIAHNHSEWKVGSMQALLGEAKMHLGETAESEKLLLSGYQSMSADRENIPVHEFKFVAGALETLVAFYETQHDLKESARWRVELQEMKAETAN